MTDTPPATAEPASDVVPAERWQTHANEDIAMLAGFVAVLSQRVQTLELARRRVAWWQLWRPKPCSLDADEHQNIWSICRDVCNYRDPAQRAQRFWNRGTREYV